MWTSWSCFRIPGPSAPVGGRRAACFYRGGRLTPDILCDREVEARSKRNGLQQCERDCGRAARRKRIRWPGEKWIAVFYPAGGRRHSPIVVLCRARRVRVVSLASGDVFLLLPWYERRHRVFLYLKCEISMTRYAESAASLDLSRGLVLLHRRPC